MGYGLLREVIAPSAAFPQINGAPGGKSWEAACPTRPGPESRTGKIETRGGAAGLSTWHHGEPGSGASFAAPALEAPAAPPGAFGCPVASPPVGRGTTFVGISAVLLCEQPDTIRQPTKPSQAVQPHCKRIIHTSGKSRVPQQTSGKPPASVRDGPTAVDQKRNNHTRQSRGGLNKHRQRIENPKRWR